MRTLILASVGTLVGTAAIAHAGNALPAGTTHNPPLFVDESTTSVELINRGEDGYWFRVAAEVSGFASGSRLRLDWTQKGKVLASAQCESKAIQAGRYGYVCASSGTALQAVGEVQALLIYEDDADDKEYLVRTYKVNPTKWTKDTWQLAADDMLGAAYVEHPNAGTWSAIPRFRFWIANAAPGVDTTFRCSVNGAKLPDFVGSLSSSHFVEGGNLEADMLVKGAHKTWHWQASGFIPKSLHWGAKTGDADKAFWLIDNPGAWDCEVRQNGVAIRRLLFTVNNQGMIESHPMQTAKDAAPLAPNVALIDIRIPAGAGFDQRIKPDQLKKSRGFGLPWPTHPSVAAIHAAFPPAYENDKPAPVAVAKGSGKMLSGMDHSPARFVDESSTEVHASAQGSKGYRIRVHTVAAGNAFGLKYRVDLKQGGKQFATAPCIADTRSIHSSLGYPKSIAGLTEVDCQTEEPLTAKGAVDALLIVHDDQDGNDYLLRTYKLNVAKFTSFGDPLFGVMGDDLLGAAYVHHSEYSEPQPIFSFWTAHTDEPMDLKLRCTVDGKKLNDIKVAPGTGRLELKYVQRKQGAADVVYAWRHLRVQPEIEWGAKETNRRFNQDSAQYVTWLVDYPGAWQCQLRNQGKAIRELRFNVANGMIVADPMSTAKGATPLVEGTGMIDIRIPKESKWDIRVRPDAFKKTHTFGLPWPDHPNVKAMLGAAPAASGLADPK